MPQESDTEDADRGLVTPRREAAVKKLIELGWIWDHGEWCPTDQSSITGASVTEAMVERLARWICQQVGINPDATHTTYKNGIDESWPEWRHYVDQATEALTAALAVGGKAAT